MPFSSLFYFHTGTGYQLSPTKAETKMNIAGFEAGPGIILRMGDYISLRGGASGGYYMGFYEGSTGRDLYYNLGGELLFNMNSSFGLALGSSYRDYLVTAGGESLYKGLTVYLGTVFSLGGAKQADSKNIREIQLMPVFPIFYKYYDSHPIGTISFINPEASSIRDVEVSVYVKQFMDTPKAGEIIREIKPGQERIINLYGLFNEKILEVTEGTKVPAQIKVTYTHFGKKLSTETTQTLRLFDRNAMSWDDDRKAAAFITAKDPEILNQSKNIAGLVRNEGAQAISTNFRIAVGMFQSLDLYSLKYVVDPQSSYAAFSADKMAIDYMQFPFQTLTYKGGDCDDLSVLYSALLESVGVSTALITVPGHIYMAFSADLSPADAKKLFVNTQNLIFEGDKTWIPVEITMIKDGFNKAWAEGAKQWREHFASGKARLYPVSEAWEIYEPVGSPKIAGTVKSPAEKALLASFNREMEAFVNREIGDRVAALEKEIISSKENPRVINTLGILFARYGMVDKAEEQFNRILAKEDFVPALINLGNIYLLKDNASKAASLYERASRKEPQNMTVLVGLAKANYQLEKYGEVRKTYNQIKNLDAGMGDKFAYLVSEQGTAGRASERGFKEDTLWSE
jgi:tetratricopeptide (TPR) repeat protein